MSALPSRHTAPSSNFKEPILSWRHHHCTEQTAQEKVNTVSIWHEHEQTCRLVQWQQHGSRASGRGELWSQQVWDLLTAVVNRLGLTYLLKQGKQNPNTSHNVYNILWGKQKHSYMQCCDNLPQSYLKLAMNLMNGSSTLMSQLTTLCPVSLPSYWWLGDRSRHIWLLKA